MSLEQTDYQEARWWEPGKDQRVVCNLCPRYCNIPVDSHGFCVIRRNYDGKLYNTAYGRSTGFAVDPIEKKPLYHFFPGTQILSFGTIGCNLGCKFCQNWHLSKVRDQEYMSQKYTAGEVVQMARRQGCIGIAYTYNDPIIFGEWVMDIAAAAREQGLTNVLVTNGYVAPSAREELFSYVDGANVDLKAFSNRFYRKLTLSKLEPVLDTLRWLVNDTQVWVEITTLIIPGENDSNEELELLTHFVAEELSPDVPLHFSAFHPDFKMTDRPSTSLEVLLNARSIAERNGLKYVYLGNVHSSIGQNTACPNCGLDVIHRNVYFIRDQNLDGDKCPGCGTRIPGRFVEQKSI